MRVAATLWRNGISAEFGYQENPKLQKQLAFALESGINWVVIMGEEEWKEGKGIKRKEGREGMRERERKHI